MLKRDLLRNIIIVTVFIAILVGLRLFVYTPYRITKQDANSFLAENDLVLADKTAKLAMENDKVTYMDNLLYLNNQVQSEQYIEKMREKYLASAASTGYYTHDFSVVDLKGATSDTIPKNSFLILNDRRENTKDSREFGLIKKEQIKGMVEFRISPLDKFGFVETK